ncbi:3-hydroxyacyl-CoA dehydrogenase/enoyl-CoA hydratase family protein [Pelagibius marinus]|uniref:3-hydroxyacyl-CoA dehydrogenase/enoyl-CoA hydratase family protein n=1 Tax=Pelagibius marinus TaxID=2762760 RepID=UPI0018729CF5|nr:3-hydroxyacyl-CoA dehydrogenase/enoyl-CoA hydratase family protein [Pelagibius marinus]
MPIQQAAVIGAGVMGAGIAAHLANAGVPVLLLDIVPEGAENRSALAEGAVAKQLKADPAPFMWKRAAKLVTPGNLEDDFDRLADCDWIIEAVLEDPEVKRDLYRRLEEVRKDGAIVSSNTSTLPLKLLTEGMPERFCADFLITHFFNPPRYMPLLELVAGERTRPEAVAEIAAFGDRVLGKAIVHCHDTPGFVANRIGTFWLQCAVVETLDRGVTVEEADAVLGRPLGVPKTGVFALLDLVGLDLMPKVDASMAATLAKDDAYHALRRPFPLLEKLIAEGYTGRKGKGGFYRLNREGGGKVKEAVDLATGDYAPAAKVSLSSVSAARKGGPRALVEHADKGGQLAWAVMSQVLSYAASLLPEIADDVPSVDRALRTGYNWKFGPFELLDRIGVDYVAARLKEEGRPIPELLEKAAAAEGFYRVKDGRQQYLTVAGDYADVERAEGVLLLSDVKLKGEPLARNGSASLWDIGDGVVCLEVHTKMNTMDPEVFKIMAKAIEIVPKGYKALVIYNEGSHFSAGANLGLAMFAANVGAWPMIEDMVAEGQKVYTALKRAPFPVVAAPSGLALGGGCEILLASDAVQAHAESYIGLVEAGVGVVPAWGGCKELLARYAHDPKRPKGPMPPVAAAFETIGLAKVAKSAYEAKELGFLRGSDHITFNRERLLADAKQKALDLVEGYRPPEPAELFLPGPSGKASLAFALRDLYAKGVATEHDMVVASELAEVLTGGPKADFTEAMSEDDILKMERAAFMRLVRTPGTMARVEHTIETGKPLRN